MLLPTPQLPLLPACCLLPAARLLPHSLPYSPCLQAYKPSSSSSAAAAGPSSAINSSSSSGGHSLGFRRQPLDAALLGHESPAPQPVADTASAALGIPGMPPPSSPPCRLVRFDHLVSPQHMSLIDPALQLNSQGLGGGSVGAAGSSSSGSGGADAGGRPQLRYSGVFVCGPRPLWLVACRGGLLVHPMDSSHGRVNAFCGFHNVNCLHGCISADHDGNMNICVLPVQVCRAASSWEGGVSVAVAVGAGTCVGVGVGADLGASAPGRVRARLLGGGMVGVGMGT